MSLRTARLACVPAARASRALGLRIGTPPAPRAPPQCEAADRPPIGDAAALPPAETFDDVHEIHDALVAAPQAEARLGGFGGFKLGWKGHPLLSDGPAAPGLPAFYSPIFAGCFRPNGATVSLARHKIFCAEAE